MLLKDLLPVHRDQKVQELTIKEKKILNSLLYH